MKTYISKPTQSTIKAKLFEEGDQDGFITRYTDGKKNRDGYVPTWGIRYEGMKPIEIPYIKWGKNGHKCLSKGFGKEYLAIYADGEKGFLSKQDLKKSYMPKLSKKKKKEIILQLFEYNKNSTSSFIHRSRWGVLADQILKIK